MLRPLFVALAVFAASCSGAASGTPVEPGETTDSLSPITTITIASTTTVPASPTTIAGRTDSLDEIVSAFVGNADGGAAVLTVSNGEVLVSAVGVADASGTPLAVSMPFRVGSLSKTMVATIILQMVDEGDVALDQRLAAYLPDTTVAGDVTVRALLGHESGMADYTDQPRFFVDVFVDRTRSFAPDEVLAYVVDAPRGSQDDFSYSNTNYILLGQVIEVVDGVSLNDSLQARIADPLGLESTVFAGRGVDAPDRLVGGWAPGLLSGDPDVEYEAVASSAWAAGSLVSTVADLETFLTALFSDGLVTRDSLAAMTDTSATGYGLGLSAVAFGEGRSGYGHNGSIPGYSATVAINPDSGDIVVVLTNNVFLIADTLVSRILTDQ